jgi:Mannosyltransferase (PIG-V)
MFELSSRAMDGSRPTLEIGPKRHARKPRLNLSSPIVFVIAAWGLSRLFFLAMGAAAHLIFDPAQPGGRPLEPPGFWNYWAHWDGGWFCAIASDGYFNAASTSFFPLYPLAIRLAAFLPGGPALWGVCISLVSLLAALFFFYELAATLFEHATARAATAALAAFPSSFFANAVYSESLFLAMSIGTIWALRARGNFYLACLFAYFAMATRNVGIFLLLPLAYHWLRHRRQLRTPALVPLALSLTGVAAYMYYLWRVLHHPLYFAIAQRETWGRTLTNPLTTLHKAWTTGIANAHYALHPHEIWGNTGAEPAFKASDTFNLIFFGLFVVLLLASIRALPLDLWLYSLTVMIVAILTPSPLWALTGFNRYMLAAFPLFIGLGRCLKRSRALFVIWLVSSLTAGAYLTALFTTWRWVA